MLHLQMTRRGDNTVDVYTVSMVPPKDDVNTKHFYKGYTSEGDQQRLGIYEPETIGTVLKREREKSRIRETRARLEVGNIDRSGFGRRRRQGRGESANFETGVKSAGRFQGGGRHDNMPAPGSQPKSG